MPPPMSRGMAAKKIASRWNPRLMWFALIYLPQARAGRQLYRELEAGPNELKLGDLPPGEQLLCPSIQYLLSDMAAILARRPSLGLSSVVCRGVMS